MNRFPLLLTTLTIATIPGCTAQPSRTAAARPASTRQCFSAREVNSFTGTKDRNVDIRVGASRYYRLDLGGGCPDINWARGIALRTTGGGLFICEGYDAEIIMPDPAGTQRCPVAGVHPITREQFFADQKY